MTCWQSVRELFPSLQNCTYLNTATYGQLSVRTVAAMQAHLARRDQFACADFLDWFDDADGIRASIAKLIHASASDIGFFQNASSAISQLAQSMEWKPGDRILTLENEFPNHLYIAQAIPQVHADIVPYSQLFDAITARTRLVMVSTVNYSSGLRPDLARLAKACRQNGTVFYVDGTQSLGALQVDVSAIQPDMFAVDGYKWLLCPNGAGFAYIHPRVREWLKPSVIGWRSDKDWRQVNHLNHGAPVFTSDAERYEGGMLPFPAIYGMGAAVQQFLDIGVETIEQRVLSLAEHARTELRSLGAILLADEDPAYIGAIVAARFPGKEPGALSLALQERGIITAARHGNLRVSTHLYNNETDIEALSAAIKDLCR